MQRTQHYIIIVMFEYNFIISKWQKISKFFYHIKVIYSWLWHPIDLILYSSAEQFNRNIRLYIIVFNFHTNLYFRTIN